MFVASSGLSLAVRYYKLLAICLCRFWGRVLYGVAHGVDLNPALRVLLLDRCQQRPEPLKRPKISADPKEVDFAQPGLLLPIVVVHAVPHALEDRGERRHTDTTAHEHGDFVLEHVFGCAAKRPVNVDPRQDAPDSRVDAGVGYADDSRFPFVLAVFILKVAAKGFSKSLGEVSNATDVDGEVVFLGSAGESERMVLP